MRKGNSQNELLNFFFLVCNCFFLPHFVGFYDNSKEAERKKKHCDWSTHSARVGAVLLFYFLFIRVFFYCNFWQFTTFIIITFIIYNYTLDSVVFFRVDLIRELVWFVINEEQCWYWWRKKREQQKKMELNSKKKTYVWIVMFVHFADKLTKGERKWMKKIMFQLFFLHRNVIMTCTFYHSIKRVVFFPGLLLVQWILSFIS